MHAYISSFIANPMTHRIGKQRVIQ